MVCRLLRSDVRLLTLQRSAEVQSIFGRVDQYNNELGLIARAFHHQFQCELTNARRHRNSLLPIHQLPREILAIILVLYMGPLNVVSNGISLQKVLCRRRNGLASVCHIWRTTIRSTPCLWAFISAKQSSKLNKTSLKLSQQQPLTCEDEGYYPVSLKRAERFWNSVRPHTNRLNTIKASTQCHIMKMLGSGLPNLERLILCGKDPLVSSLDAPWPQLRHLELRGVSLPWSCLLASNLASLKLNRIKDLSLSMFVALLRSSPQLEALCIELITLVLDQPISPVPLDARILLPLVQELEIAYMPGRIFNYIVNLVEPRQLTRLSLTHKLGLSHSSGFSSMPDWSVQQGIKGLLRNNHVRLQYNLTYRSSGFWLDIAPKIAFTWLAKVIAQYPESSPPIKVECFNFDLDLLIQYFPDQLDRCELIVKNTEDPENLRVTQYLCERVPSGWFPFPSLIELYVNLSSEAMADAFADLLEERYRDPMQVKPLQKLTYKNWTGGPFPNLHERIAMVLKDCALEWVAGTKASRRCYFESGSSQDEGTYSDDQVDSDWT